MEQLLCLVAVIQATACPKEYHTERAPPIAIACMMRGKVCQEQADIFSLPFSVLELLPDSRNCRFIPHRHASRTECFFVAVFVVVFLSPLLEPPCDTEVLTTLSLANLSNKADPVAALCHPNCSLIHLLALKIVHKRLMATST